MLAFRFSSVTLWHGLVLVATPEMLLKLLLTIAYPGTKYSVIVAMLEENIAARPDRHFRGRAGMFLSPAKGGSSFTFH